MLHLYFNEESDYSEENTCDNEVHHKKKLNIFTLQLPIYYIHYQNRKHPLVQMGILQKQGERNRLPLL